MNHVVDANTGRVDLRYNPLSVEEDYFIPIRGGEASKIDTLQGGQFTGDIDDVKYLRDKLFSALKIPASYLSSDTEASEDKTTLAQKDVRFARTIQRLQRAVITELEKMGIVHLYTLGFRGDDLVSFRLALNNPSQIAALQELENWKTKFDVASAATENFFSRRWVSENIFGLSDEEFIRNQREIYYDRKYEAQLATAAEEAAQSGTEADTDTGTDFDLGGEDTGGDDLDLDFGDTEGGETDLDVDVDEEPADEGPLLAAPAKRNDQGRKYTPKSLSRKSRHPYTPTASDGRKSGRQNSYFAHAFPGSPQTGAEVVHGKKELGKLSRGLFEAQGTTYMGEEALLFETNSRVRDLISELEDHSEFKLNENETQQKAK